MDIKDLKDGQWYLFRKYFNNLNASFVKAKCNISPRGDEIWFTDSDGIEVSGDAIREYKEERIYAHDCRIEPKSENSFNNEE